MDKRFISVAARGSSMAAIFFFGFAYSFRAPLVDSSNFFISLAAVSLLIFIFGLEVHVYSDRAVARGMNPKLALKKNFLIQVPLIIVGFLLVVPACKFFDWEIVLVMLIILNAMIGLFVQEYFRIFIAIGHQHLANFLMILRSTLPFVLLLLWLLLRVDVNLETVLVVWFIGGLIAGLAAIVILQRLEVHQTSLNYALLRALKTSSLFFPSALISRVLFSVDLFVIGLIGDPLQVTIYGNASNISAALVTFVDLAIIQWRFKSVVQSERSTPFDKKLFSETFKLGIVAFASMLSIAIWLLVSDANPANLSSSIFVTCLAFSSFFAILAQGRQLFLYSFDQDRVIFRGYATSFGVFMTFFFLAFIFTNVFWVVLGRAISLAVLFIIFDVTSKGIKWKIAK